MKKLICKRALLALAITSCCFMMSCANSQSTDEGAQLDGAEQTLSDNGDAPKNDQAANDLSDLDAAANPPADGSAPPAGADTAPPPDANAQAPAAGGGEDLEKAMASNGSPDAAAPPPDAGAGAPPADPNAAPPPDAGAPAADASAAPPPDAGAPPPDANAAGGPPPDAGAPPPDANVAANPPPDAGGAPGGELAPPPPDAGANPVADAAAASAASGKKAHKHGGVASAPKVKQAPFKKGSVTLNRFYFARKGDTAKSISQLIYGTADRAKEMKRWNKGSFTAGKLVYYASPNQPDDTVMKSFYEERGLTPEQYQVRPGDKMTKIASKKLGSSQSWKEIAVLNGLAKINAITDGQTLAIYTDLKGAAPAAQPTPTEAPAPQLAGAGVNPYQNQAGQPNQAVPNQPQGGAAVANDPAHPGQPQSQPIPDPPVAQADPNAQPGAGEQPAFMNKKRNREGGVNMGKLLQQNAFFIVMGLGISALLMALLAINKRKKARGEDFAEDGFGATAVKKRR